MVCCSKKTCPTCRKSCTNSIQLYFSDHEIDDDANDDNIENIKVHINLLSIFPVTLLKHEHCNFSLLTNNYILIIIIYYNYIIIIYYL